MYIDIIVSVANGHFSTKRKSIKVEKHHTPFLSDFVGKQTTTCPAAMVWKSLLPIGKLSRVHRETTVLFVMRSFQFVKFSARKGICYTFE